MPALNKMKEAKPKDLVWKAAPGSITAVGLSGLYRIVYKHGYHCLRLESRGKDFEWLGQFPSGQQARDVGQDHDRGQRRLKAWHRYMLNNDPPAELDPDWQL